MKGPQNFLFTAWFQDRLLAPDEQDYEWPACFEVLAASAVLASDWGLRLAHAYVSRNPNLSLLRHSTVPQPGGSSGNLPVISYGTDASDSDIGW